MALYYPETEDIQLETLYLYLRQKVNFLFKFPQNKNPCYILKNV